MRLLTILLTLSLNGCFFFFVVPVGGEPPGYRQALNEYEEQMNHRAFAVARGSRMWAWAWSGALATADYAEFMALSACDKNAQQAGISTKCEIYSVDGQIVGFDNND